MKIILTLYKKVSVNKANEIAHHIYKHYDDVDDAEVKDVSTALEKLEKIMGKPWIDIEKIEYINACEEAYKILS